jgi:sugar phosphate isomerase/epimerase
MNLKYLTRLLSIFAAAALTAASTAAELQFRAGCQAYTFNQFTAYEAVEKTHEAGGTVIEFYSGQTLSAADPVKVSHSLSEPQIASLLTQLEKNHVVATSWFSEIPKDEQEARKVFVFAKRMKLQSITTESAESIDTIEKLVKEFDIRVGFHQHAKRPNDPGYRLWDPNFVYGLVKDRDRRIGACADTGHWATSGLVPLDALKVLKGRVVSLHLKDRQSIGGETTDQILGTGISGIAGILTELRRTNFDGCLYIEYEANWGNNVSDVRKCLEFVRNPTAKPPAH